MPEMTDEMLSGLLDGLIKDAKDFRDADLMPDRIRAQEYYDGTMKDTPADDNRSQVISKDVRAAIKKVLPSIVRTILGNDKVVEYQPVGQGDEGQAEQATDYINSVVFPESGGYNAIKDAIHNALLMRNGVLTWWYDRRVKIEESEHTGLTEPAFAQMVADESVTVLEHSPRNEQVDTPEGPQEVPVHDIKIRRQVTSYCCRLRSVPMEEFLISSTALDMCDAQLVGTVTKQTRSDLVAMGYGKDLIYSLSKSERDDDEEYERDTRRQAIEETEIESEAMEEIDYYELFVRMDYDGDGIAELRRMCLAGGTKAKNVLANDVWDEPQIGDVVCERRPHQWEGQSLFDDIQDIQRIKTVLFRATLDNLYWQNNAQPTVDESKLVNPESVTKRNFGEPVRFKQGTDVRTAIGFLEVPMFAKDSFAMLGYLDEVLTDRTGISDAASGLAPDALQNMTAKATALIEQAGIGQIELMVRTIAECLKRVFQGLLRLTIKHQDVPRTVRLRGEWVTFDPRQWNAEMDCTVNTGLGAGTRERDMMMMQQVIALQKEILVSMGPDNPYVKPDNLYNSIAKLTEAAGLHNPDLYFTKPDPEEVQRKMKALAQKKSPEEQKAEADMAVEKVRGQIDIQTTEAKIAADAAKEREQRDADLVVKQAELQHDLARQQAELAAQERIKAMDIAWEREKFAQEQELERERMEREDARAKEQRQADIQRAQADSFGREVMARKEAA